MECEYVTRPLLAAQIHPYGPAEEAKKPQQSSVQVPEPFVDDEASHKADDPLEGDVSHRYYLCLYESPVQLTLELHSWQDDTNERLSQADSTVYRPVRFQDEIRCKVHGTRDRVSS